MNYLPTDIFEDLLSDVVGKNYSGPPLAAADLQVLSGPGPEPGPRPQIINIAKVADKGQFINRHISGPHRQFNTGPQPPIINIAEVANKGQFGNRNIAGPHRLFNTDSSKTQTSKTCISTNLPSSQPESSGKDVKRSNSPSRQNSSSPEDDSQVADPQCLLMIKNILQYSYNKWRVKNYDAVKPNFWFLFEHNSEEYKYYRLKLAQLLQLKNITVDTESQVNGHERTAGDVKTIQTTTVGTQTDLKMGLFNLSLADLMQQPPRQSPAVPELLHSQIVASQHSAPYAATTAANAPEAFNMHNKDVNLKRFSSACSLDPRSLPRQILPQKEMLCHQSISQKTVPCPPATTSNSPWTSQSHKYMETIKSFISKPCVASESSKYLQFSEIDEITKKAVQNLAHLHVISQEKNRGSEMLKGPEFWFLNEKSSPVYKYYRMKLTELRQARGLPDDPLECENLGKAKSHGPKTLDVNEPLCSEADHPEPQGSKAEHPLGLGHEHKKTELQGRGEQRPKTLDSKCQKSSSRKPTPDKFELLVTCSDDEDSDADSDAGSSSPLFRAPDQPQVQVSISHLQDQKLPFQNLDHQSSLTQNDLVLVTEEDQCKPLEEMDLTSEESPVSSKAQQSLYPKALQNNLELKSQYMKPQRQLRQNSLDLVPEGVSSHSPQKMQSKSEESKSKKAMQHAAIQQSPLSRKRSHLPKEVTVPPKRMYPAEETTGCEPVPQKSSEHLLVKMELKPAEGPTSLAAIHNVSPEPLSQNCKPESKTQEPPASLHSDGCEPDPQKSSEDLLVQMELKPTEGPTSVAAIQNVAPEPLPQDCKPEPKTRDPRASLHSDGSEPVPEKSSEHPLVKPEEDPVSVAVIQNISPEPLPQNCKPESKTHELQASLHSDGSQPVPEKSTEYPLVKPEEDPVSVAVKQNISPEPLPQNCKPESKTHELQASLHSDGHEPVSEKVSLQPLEEMKSNFTESLSEEAMQSATVKQSPRKRGRLPKGVTVTPKKVCPAEESTVLTKPGSKKPEVCQDLQKSESKEGTSSIDDKDSPEGGSKEILSPGPEKKLVRSPGKVTPTATNDASNKRVTRLKK